MSDSLPYTDDASANALLADDPFALLVGIVLYQQVAIETAFAGPSRINERLGGLDPQAIAQMDPELLEAAFKEKPAVHRFPGNMAKRVQAVAAFVASEYDGDTSAIWADVDDADELMRRLKAMPGFGDYKATDLPRCAGAKVRRQAGRLGTVSARLAQHIRDRVAGRSQRPQGAEEGMEGGPEGVVVLRRAVLTTRIGNPMAATAAKTNHWIA